MYEDQAAELRNLVYQSSTRNRPANSPKVVVVTGGKRGVGTSTIATTVAATLARQGRRVVVADANTRGAQLHGLAPLTNNDLDDVDIRSIQPTAEPVAISTGIKLHFAPWHRDESQSSPRPSRPCETDQINHFVNELLQFQGHADFVVVDAGNGAGTAAGTLCSVADVVFLTTTCEAVAVMDSYAAIKSIHEHHPIPLAVAVVNQSNGLSMSADVFRRLSQSCQHFLDLTLTDGGSIPVDPLLASRDGRARVGLLRITDSPAVRAVEHVVNHVKATLRQQAVRRSA